MLNTLKVSLTWAALVSFIFVLFFYFVYNPNEVILGSDIIKDGHIVTATKWDVMWSFLFPIEYAFWTAIVCTAIITIVDVLWRNLINSVGDDL